MRHNKNKSEKKNQPIGVFDSGVGGLSVLRELQQMLPHENFVFLADQLRVPYGEKSRRELVKITKKITNYFIKHHNIKMMVVACNTATCGAIDELRNKYSFPLVGTVPAVKVAAQMTRSGTVAIISTPSTSKSPALQKLIRDNCASIRVINIGCKNLEDTVEEGELNGAKVKYLLIKYLESVRNSDADYLVLGCTHYPFLKKSIQKIVGPRVILLDSGKAIAKHTRSLLIRNNIENNEKKSAKTIYLTTGNPVRFSKVAGKLLERRIESEKIKI